MHIIQNVTCNFLCVFHIFYFRHKLFRNKSRLFNIQTACNSVVISNKLTNHCMFVPAEEEGGKKLTESWRPALEAPPAKDYKANVGAGAGQRGSSAGSKKYTGAANPKLSRLAQLSNKHILFLLLSESTPVAAKMTTAVVSPFFDFEVMNKVPRQLFSLVCVNSC